MISIERADQSDSDELNSFLAKTPLRGSVDLVLERPSGFFTPYELHSSDYQTYILRSETKEIMGTASLIFQSGAVDGKPQTIGYATDLRLSKNRRALKEWSNNFLPVIEYLQKKYDCQYIFSAINASQNKELNAIIRPRNIRRSHPRYHLLRRFRLIGIHGRYPWSPRPLESLTINIGSENDVDELFSYIRQKNERAGLIYTLSAEQFRDRLTRWDRLTMTNFWIARDKQGGIVGCVAPWSSDKIQTYRVITYHGLAQTIYTALKGLSWVSGVRPLAKPKEKLNFSFLTHFYADHPDILDTLLFHCYTTAPKRQFLIYPYFEGDLLKRPGRGWLTTRSKYALYTILRPDQDLPEALRPHRTAQPPEFEPAFL